MKISNFTPEWGDLIAGPSSVAADTSARHTVMLDLTNVSGSARTMGDVVALSQTTAESFTTSTASNTVAYLGVLDEDIGISSNGRVVVEGYARAVNTVGTSGVGDFLYGSTTTAKAAHMAGTIPIAGAFGLVLSGGSNTNSTAYIFPTVQGSTSAASNTTDVGQSSLAGQTGKYSDGAHVHRGIHTIAHSSNTFYGDITLTTPDGTVAITSPATGTLALSSVASGGGSGLGSWQSYTPTWSSDGTPPTTGNATLSGRYRLLDGTSMQLIIHFVRGSTSANGTGTYTLSLPSGYVGGSLLQVVSARFLDSGTANLSAAAQLSAGASAFFVYVSNNTSATTNQTWTPTYPVTLATGDSVTLSGVIEYAPA